MDAKKRGQLQNRIERYMLGNERVKAAWLLGSIARGDQDEYSDLDVAVVIYDRDRDLLSNWAAVVDTFGTVVSLHEAPQNAPKGGTMLSTLYDNGIMVDWTIIPESVASRPVQSLLLFEKEPIPLASPPEPLSKEEADKQLQNRLSYFWMMATITTKVIHRGQGVKALIFIDMLVRIAQEMEDLSSGQIPSYLRDVDFELVITKRQQFGYLREVCERVASLFPEASQPVHTVVLGLIGSS